MFQKRKLSANSVGQHLAALRFLYIKTLKRAWSIDDTLFSQWAVQESTEYLRKTYTKDGYWAEVRVQEELSDAALRVTFSVLVFPQQTVIVDGHELQSTKENANDASKVQ